MKKIAVIIFTLLLLSTIGHRLSTAYAAVPHLINYQGRLTDKDAKPLDGSYSIAFRIYDAESAGNLLWEETQAGVVVQKGIFSILLGSVKDLNLAFDKPYWLEIKVGSEVMSPRQRISSVGYAITAESAEKIKADSSDPALGYLSEKLDNSTIKLDPVTHKIYAPVISRSRVFTSSGTFTAPAGVTTVYLTVVAGGGGGGGSDSPTNFPGGGGAAGECVVNYPYTVTSGNNYPVTVGTGGTGGTGGVDATSGKAGGNSVFDALTLAGGNYGYASGNNNPGAGGTGGLTGGHNHSTGSIIKLGGTSGSGGGATGDNGANSEGGGGGAALFGNGGIGGYYGGYHGSTAGGNGSGYGSGGGGGTGSSDGGDGTAGYCLVEW